MASIPSMAVAPRATNEVIHRTPIHSAFASWDLESENVNIDIFVQPLYPRQEEGDGDAPQIQLQYQKFEQDTDRRKIRAVLDYLKRLEDRLEKAREAFNYRLGLL